VPEAVSTSTRTMHGNWSQCIQCLLVIARLSTVWAAQGALVTAADSVSHGRQVLLDRGLQLSAWTFTPDQVAVGPGFTNVAQFLNANFTTVNFFQSAYTPLTVDAFQQQATVPWQWGRLSSPDLNPVLTPQELPYLGNFTSLSYGDELPQTQATLDAEKAAFAQWNANYPDALAFTNFYGGGLGGSPQMNASTLKSYMDYTHPDILSFDNYPGFAFTTSQRNGWYSTMQLYRTTALAGYDGTGTSPIPYQQYLDLYRSSYSAALPSESFVRLEQFASWAFGFTMTTAFVYNKPNDPSVYPVLFSSTGDTAPTAVLGYVAESNRESRNLGPALVRLVSTDIRMIPGSGHSVSGTGITAWSPSANGGDNYITAITPTLTQGGANSASYNDILVGYFKPLLADNSDYPFANGTHFMIVNGASQGTAAASAQWYHITFNFGTSGFNALEMLDRDTGLVDVLHLTHLSGSLYSLDINLPGGTGDLFRFYTIPEPTTLAMVMSALVFVSCSTLRRYWKCLTSVVHPFDRRDNTT
jgi:hypothetical protein